MYWTRSSGLAVEPTLGSQSTGKCSVLGGHQRGVCDFRITLRSEERQTYWHQTKRNRSLRYDWRPSLTAFGSPNIDLCETDAFRKTNNVFCLYR
jgi:hypothetical protein